MSLRVHWKLELTQNASETFFLLHSLLLHKDLQRLSFPSPLTCRELQTSVHRHSWSFALPDVHGELQAVCVYEGAIGEGETHFICTPVDRLRGVDQQLVQDVLVGEGRALCEHLAVFQRLRVELPSADFAWGKERLMNLWYWSSCRCACVNMTSSQTVTGEMPWWANGGRLSFFHVPHEKHGHCL